MVDSEVGDSVRAAVAEELPKLAVIVAVCVDETTPATTEKVPEAAPAATLTDTGTLSAELLSESEISAPPAGAAPESVTLQTAAAPGARAVGLQDNDESVALAASATAAVIVLPGTVAVIVAVWFDEKLPALTVKTAAETPPGTVTVPGTDRTALLSDSETGIPPDGAAIDTATVQLADAPGPSVAGEHAREESTAWAETTTDPPVAVMGMLLPEAEAATGLVTPTFRLAAAVLRVICTEAMTPLGMMFAFMPAATHV